MQRIVTSRDLGDGLIRTRVRIEGDPCDPDTFLADQMRLHLLSNIAENMHLVNCGSGPFQTLRMFHDNAKWIVEVEATRKTPNG
jgi:hypothetical protein